MAEAKQYVFNYQEIAEALLKELDDVVEGHWGIYMEFAIKGANVGHSENEMMPAAIVPVVKIGIQRFDEPNPLTVDAAKVKKGRTSAKRKT